MPVKIKHANTQTSSHRGFSANFCQAHQSRATALYEKIQKRSHRFITKFMKKISHHTNLILILFNALSLSTSVFAKPQEYKPVFVGSPHVFAQVNIWQDKSLSPGRYAVDQASAWYEKIQSTQTAAPTNDFLLVFLGQTPTEIWTLEAGTPHDAAVTLFFNFVRTRNDGKRIEKELIKSFSVEDNSQPSMEELHETLLGNLWNITNKLKDSQNQLQPVVGNILTTTQNSNPETCSILAKTTATDLCYSLAITAEMCWHHFTWQASTLKKQKGTP